MSRWLLTAIFRQPANSSVPQHVLLVYSCRQKVQADISMRPFHTGTRSTFPLFFLWYRKASLHQSFQVSIPSAKSRRFFDFSNPCGFASRGMMYVWPEEENCACLPRPRLELRRISCCDILSRPARSPRSRSRNRRAVLPSISQPTPFMSINYRCGRYRLPHLS